MVQALLAKPEDYKVLLDRHPLAKAQLEAIVLARVLIETQAELAAAKSEAEPVEPSGD